MSATSSTARLVPQATFRRMPWKNGGGETVEMLVSPPDAGLADFDWRLSMATVAQSGPFSLFQGIDRTLAVIEGEAIVLEVAGRAPATLDRAAAPYAFAGDANCAGHLPAGPIVDLNIMTRRARWRHAMRRLSGPAEITPETDLTILVLRGAPATIFTGSGTIDAAGGDCIVLEGRHPVAINATATAEIYLIALAPA